MIDYREEIDGLRAVAVLAVVLYHAGFTTYCAGGYVGVDVFFVISGYLITSIIEHDYKENRFSIVLFYERRCRRIVPALVFILMFSSICTPVSMMNEQLKEYGQTLISIVCLSSNFFFWWKDDGYFSRIAELNPLVHTWSLAVEEQFYLCFPLIYRVCRHHQRLFHFILVSCGILSFSLCQWGGHFQLGRNDGRFHLFFQHSLASFYLPFGRAWELLLGSFVAFRLQHYSSDNFSRWNNVPALIGFVMVIASSVYLDSRSIPTFPNIYTLLPTCGSVLILLYGTKETLIGRFLSLRLLRWIGLISYSVYLWHQPCFTFLRLKSAEIPSTKSLFVATSAVFPLATFTYICVEQPFRRKAFNRKQIFSATLMSGMLTLIVGYYLIGSADKRTTLVNNQQDTYLSDLQKYGNYHR